MREYTDTELLDWLASMVFLPNDTPNGGVYAVVGEDIAPIGTFTGNDEKDAAAFRRAIIKEMLST